MTDRDAARRPPLLSFIVPVRNDAERLRVCLASIAAGLEHVDAEVLVADNGSTDDSAAVAERAGVRVLRVPGRPVAEVRNIAARDAAGSLLAFVDADHEVGAGWATAALQTLDDPTIVAVGAQYHAPSGGTWVQRMYDRFRRHQPGAQDVDWLPSGNLVVRREAFERAGGFDATLETCEDVDLCQRLRRQGGRIVSVDRLKSVHRGDPSTLRALFFGELWRGRDNVRVTLRGPLSARDVPSLAIPVLNLIALVALVAGVAAWPIAGPWIPAIAAVTLGTLIVLRAAALLAAPGGAEDGPALAGQAVLVAAVYNLARALALVSRSGHGVRRKA